MEKEKKCFKRILPKMIATVMLLSISLPSIGVRGNTDDELIEKKKALVEKKESFIKTIDEQCESIKDDIEKEQFQVWEDDKKADELVNYVQETYGERSKENMSEIEMKAVQDDICSRFNLNKPVIISTRKGFMIRMMFFNMPYEDGRRIQIWGRNKKNYFLIKDYGVKIDNSYFPSKYDWDITNTFEDGRAISVDNISEKNESGLEKLYDVDLDNVGIYITSRPETSCEEPITYFKNFSLIERDIFRGIDMVTSYDDDNILKRKSYEVTSVYLEGMNVNQNSQYPAVAMKDENFVIALFKEQNEEFQNYRVTIKGWNDGENYKVSLVGKDGGLNKYIYNWVPEHDGVFNLVAEKNSCGKWIPVIIRKVFVRRQQNTGYLGIEDMIVEDKEGNMNVNIKTQNFNSADYNPSQVALKIGEESIWSKTLKNYDSYRYSIEDGETSGSDTTQNIHMSEIDNGFRMASGKYFVDALVKKSYSSEYEDIARRDFTRDTYGFGELFEIKSNLNSSDAVMNREYSFVMKGTEKLSERGFDEDKLEYAMLLWDARGKRVIKSYDQEQYFQYTFTDPGRYKIYLRARIPSSYREENGVRYLKNSYLEEQVLSVNVPMEKGESIEIKNVTLEKFGYQQNEFEKKSSESISVESEYEYAEDGIKSHSKNRIIIDAVKKNRNGQELREKRLMYQVYAIHDGIWECLTPYTTSKIITFYPRSEGKYKLLVLVKDSVSGSEEDSVIIEVEADNNY